MMQIQDMNEEPRPGEHRGEDGLIYCDQCGKPRQFRLPLTDPPKVVRCQCRCQQEQQAKQQQELRMQEEMDRLDRLRSVSILDPGLRGCTFEASRFDSKALEIARRYVDTWPHEEQPELGLLFWGSVGTGKSYIASCIANALVDRHIPVLMTSFSQILGELPGPASGEQTAFLRKLNQHPLLILDDLGVERDTPYAMELVYSIIDARYRSGRPMILTTNLTMQELENPDSREKARIYDRVLERCTPVRVEGRNLRREKREAGRQVALKYLT